MPPYQWQQAWQRSRRKDLLEGQQEAHKARVSPELWDGSSCLDKRDGIAPRAMHWCFRVFAADCAIPRTVEPQSPTTQWGGGWLLSLLGKADAD